jgi:hypothetical protein
VGEQSGASGFPHKADMHTYADNRTPWVGLIRIKGLPADHTPDSVNARACSRRHTRLPPSISCASRRPAAPGLAGITHLHRRGCDETTNRASPLHGPLTLLPAARSPGR